MSACRRKQKLLDALTKARDRVREATGPDVPAWKATSYEEDVRGLARRLNDHEAKCRECS